MIGLLMLVGIVVTNAIVLLDMVKQRERQGMSTREALIAGGRIRVRPILMTAVATILATAPEAIGSRTGSFIAGDLGMVVIGGLLSSTLLTLLVIPVLYSLVSGMKRRLGFRGPQEDGHEEDGETGAQVGREKVVTTERVRGEPALALPGSGRATTGAESGLAQP